MGLAELDRLLTAHQAIIDAWYADWLAAQKALSDALWAKRDRAQSEDASRKRGE